MNISQTLPSVSGGALSGIAIAQPDNARGDNSLDQAAFLKLMTAQLKMQDPFDPMDNNAMVGQMAQFSTVAGIGEMNASLAALASGAADNRVGDASSWLGHHILVPGRSAMPDEIGRYAGEFSLDAPSDSLSIDFINAHGEIVQAIELGKQAPGPIAYEWDARDADGLPVPHGELRVRVNGGPVSGLASWTRVEAVQSPGNMAEARLLTAQGEFSVAEAIRLS